ncbi:hypothetical protein CDCA_CDCA02G0641 [Cyanidium caldarium]|uniref:Uncharacterized protein n=1 Tax=Cyanidium caldarium TaxID=2771 RepID=A0AAV9IRA9_CYACA|nr:hypothetical protein CDCA_CDCA02G0641 [Cyanidium caldarium]
MARGKWSGTSRHARGRVARAFLYALAMCVVLVWGAVLVRWLGGADQARPSLGGSVTATAANAWSPVPDEVSIRSRFRWALSLDRPGHCTVIVGVHSLPRSAGLVKILEWFGEGVRRVPASAATADKESVPPLQRPKYLRGVTPLRLRALYNASSGTPSSTRGLTFSATTSPDAIRGETACSVSHLMALRWALGRGCHTALFLEDDTSLDLLPLWDRPVGDWVNLYCTPEAPVLQMELKMRAFVELGHSGPLQVERLPVRCSSRYALPHLYRKTYGTGAYGMSREGMRRTLSRFVLPTALPGVVVAADAESLARSAIDVSEVLRVGSHADVFVILNETTTRVLWPPYFYEQSDARSEVRPGTPDTGHRRVHRASALHAMQHNVRWAGECALVNA